jgi:hypothetical protein
MVKSLADDGIMIKIIAETLNLSSIANRLELNTHIMQ